MFSRHNIVPAQHEVLQRVEDLAYEIERQFRDGVVAGGDIQMYCYHIECALTNINRIYTPDLDTVIEGLRSLNRLLVAHVNSHLDPTLEAYIAPRLYSGEFCFLIVLCGYRLSSCHDQSRQFLLC